MQNRVSDMEIIKNVCPTVEDCLTNNNLQCSEDGCTAIFTSESNLTLHLVKTHKKSNNWKAGVITHYFCPETSCNYHKKRWFKTKKLLRQHYTKVHVQKAFNCETCPKSFPTKATLSSHKKFCGVWFRCCDCNSYYGVYETLKTHCRRKKHKLLNKEEYLDKTGTEVPMQKPLDKIVQTETGNLRLTRSCETQTLKPLIFKGEMQEAGISINTQTVQVPSKSQSCNTSFSFEELNLVFKEETGTQTCLAAGPSRELLNDKTLDPNLGSLEDPNCNMETQTDFFLEEDLLKYCELYSDMHTQTNNDILAFSDIETQTAMDDVQKSVESQTDMFKSRIPFLANNIDSQTQTDKALTYMLEGIHF